MNVYDFDQTIYYPDSSYHFFLYCLKKHPRFVLPVIPGAVRMALRYRRGDTTAKQLKQHLFSFLNRLESTEDTVNAFWEEHRDNLQDWYLRQLREDDVIISASPEFLLEPITRELGVALIATPMDSRSGQIHGENCHDVEKVRRFYEKYPDAEIEAFYSDSLSDAPMARLAKAAYLVKRGELLDWPSEER